MYLFIISFEMLLDNRYKVKLICELLDKNAQCLAKITNRQKWEGLRNSSGYVLVIST